MTRLTALAALVCLIVVPGKLYAKAHPDILSDVGAVQSSERTPHAKKQRQVRHARHRHRRHSGDRAVSTRPRKPAVSLAGYSIRLMAKVHEIEQACGSHLTPHGGYRPGARVRGSGHASLHASKRAVDMVGNPRCIYSHLEDWRGGVSVPGDYARVGHVHFDERSYRIRFAHYRARRVRYAARR